MYYRARKEKKETPPFAMAVFLISGAVFGLLVFSLLFETVRVNEESMSPAVNKGAIVLVFEPYKGKQGSIVLIKHPFQKKALMLSRIAAMQDDTIEIVDKQIFVNSVPWKVATEFFTDSRIFPADFTARDNMSKIAIPSNFCFIIGDNRDVSFDSRTFGPVQTKRIVGTVVFVIKK